MTKSKSSYKLTTSPPDTCYLLRLPPEIRFLIYRLLFIPQPAHYFLDPEIPNRTTHVEWWLPKTTKVQNHLHTTIFRTNRRINAEATSLLYKELTLVVCPTDIAVLRQFTKLDIVEPLDSSSQVWRYDPRRSAPIMSHSSMSPGPMYLSKPLHGKMYPHIFARFHNINLNLSLTYPIGSSLFGTFKGFSFDRSANVRSEQITSFAADTCSTSLIRDFVTLLSHSPAISALWITLDIVAWATYRSHAGEEIQCLLQKTANMKAAEIWLECGVLDPLKELTNVECAILNVRCPTEGCFATLQPEYAAIAEKLEEDIESGGSMD